AKRGYRLDDVDDGRGDLACRGRRWRDASQPEQALPPRGSVRYPARDPGGRHAAGLRHRRPAAARLPLRRPHAGATVVGGGESGMTVAYRYGKPLLRANGVSVSLGGTPILRDVNLEVRDLI